MVYLIDCIHPLPTCLFRRSDNIFFALQRKKIIQEQESKLRNDGIRSQGPIKAKVGFANLANIISKRWWDIDEKYKMKLEKLARNEKERYDKDMLRWKQGGSSRM
jgi:hypothetical protein